MSLEIFARSSLAQFCLLYTDLFDGEPIQPTELEALMWGRMCAKDAGITKTGFKIPYDNIKRAKVTLPYMPHDITYTGCTAIKKNGGLYTPCCGKIAEDAFYCKSCSLDKEGEVKELQFGDINSRNYNVENEQFAPITFAEWMKGNTSLPEVYAKLREAGIALEVPAHELICRELPKRRKGRPARSDDSVVDEDSVPKKKASKAKVESDSESEVEAPKKKATKAKKADTSEDDAPKAKASKKAAPKAKAADSEDEAPKAKKAAKPASKAKAADSEDEAPKKASKKAAPKAKAADSEDEAPKAKKAAKPAPKAKSASPAASDDDAPKKAKAKAKSAASDDEAPKKASKKAAVSEDEKPSKAKPAKTKSPAASDDEAPKKKAGSGSDSDTPKKASKAAPKPAPTPEAEPEEAEEEVEIDDQEVEIMGEDGEMHDYILRNGKFICDMEDGKILGTIDEDGNADWN
jgi:hypothetical protein